MKILVKGNIIVFGEHHFYAVPDGRLFLLCR